MSPVTQERALAAEGSPVAQVSITHCCGSALMEFCTRALRSVKEAPAVPGAWRLSEPTVSCPVLQGAEERVNTSQNSVVLGIK